MRNDCKHNCALFLTEAIVYEILNIIDINLIIESY